MGGVVLLAADDRIIGVVPPAAVFLKGLAAALDEFEGPRLLGRAGVVLLGGVAIGDCPSGVGSKGRRLVPPRCSGCCS